MLANEIFASNTTEKPDGIIIVDEMLTSGALIALQQQGIQVGKDVKIATQSNVGSTTLYGLTENMLVFEFDPLKLVKTMFSILDMLLAGKEPATYFVSIAPKKCLLTAMSQSR